MSKRLYRSRENRMVSGVAGGLSEYFDVDPVIVRALFLITTLGGGTGLIAYIVLWIIVPLRPYQFSDPNYDYTGKSKKSEGTEVSDEDDSNPQNDNIYENYSANSGIHNEYREDNTREKNNSKLVFGAILVIIGILFLLDNVFVFMSFNHLWPIALVLLGAFMLYQAMSNKEKGEENESI